MREAVVISGRLTAICAVAAVALGLVNAVTAPRIASVKERQLAAALELVTAGRPAGAEVAVDDDPMVDAYYPLSAVGGGDAGFVLKLRGIGYGGDMEILATYGPDGEIAAVVLLDNLETPGLGKNAETTEYMEKFRGTGADVPVPVTKQQLNQEQADTVSGASITFMGIGQALASGAQYARELAR